MGFRETQSCKEIQSDWHWIHSMDPEAAAEADRWIADHPEERKELERMLYRSEAKYSRLVSSASLEDAEAKQTGAYDPEAFLPEKVRNRIYGDKRWFNRAAYLPPDSDEEYQVYLNRQLVEGLHMLTELQRQVIFRNIVNGESTESIAQDMGCTSRNVRDIRNRALKILRRKITQWDGFGKVGKGTWIVFMIAGAYILLGRWFALHVSLSKPIQDALMLLSAPIVVWSLWYNQNRDIERLLYRHWAYMNGQQRE